MTKQYTIPIFVPHLGCPFDCVFCNQRRITGKSTNISEEEVVDTIEEYLTYFDRDARLEIGFFGGSFTGIDDNIQDRLLKIAYDYKSQGKIDGIRLSTRPDFIDDKVITRLKKYDVDIVELGVQSLDQEVLNASGRGHSIEVVYEASEKLKKSGLGLGLQMMVGLPLDDFSKGKHTVEEFIGLDPECVRIYPTLVVKDTYLERLFLTNKYTPLDIETAVEYISDYLIMFENKDINVIRIGLQPTENMQLGRDVISGPFHPSFGQLVESNIYRKILDHYLLDLENLSEDLTIYSNKKNISSIVGQKGINREYLKNKYGFKRINFLKDDRVKGKDFSIGIGKENLYIDYKNSLNLYLNKKH